MAKTMMPPDIAKLSFEDALKELEDIVRRLETGNAKLDDALGAYERGALLKQHCETARGAGAGRQDRHRHRRQTDDGAARS